MKNIKHLFLLLIMACASPRVVYDYDTQENFNQYKTFNFFDDAGEGLNKFDIERIEMAIENTLLNQGFKKSESPNFYINYTIDHQENVENNNVGIGIGGGNGGFGVGISTGISIGAKKINQLLTIDFVSEKEDALFWQSTSESVIRENLKPDDRTKHYQKVVLKMLSQYPPKKK